MFARYAPRSRPARSSGCGSRSEVASLHWADVDFSDGNDVVVTVRRSKTDPTVCSAVAASVTTGRSTPWSFAALSWRASPKATPAW